jgi:hypothetical protein
LADEQRANPVQRQHALLIERLDRDKPPVRSGNGIADCLGCVFRGKSATDSGMKSATDSDLISAIPI